MLATESLQEAERLMTVCNSCRYCEGLCAVFPAMEMRRAFAEGDLNLIANLCHNCGACYDDCQFTPPHDFAVNVPQTLARVRRESWEAYVWPRACAGLLRHNATALALGTAGCIALSLVLIAWLRDPALLFSAQRGPGAFYRIVPHNVLAAVFGGVFLYAAIALFMGPRAFWRDVSEADPLPSEGGSLWQAMREAGSLRYLDGGGAGCADEEDQPRDNRRLFHHLTFYGFLLCFASTSVATLYHYLVGREAPYAWWEPPVVLGTLGGIGLVIGPVGLLTARLRRRPELGDPGQHAMDNAFTALLLFTSLSGLALLLLRETAAMGTTLAVHLGFVAAFFLAMPYSRFVHGLYRFAALVRYAAERRHHANRS